MRHPPINISDLNNSFLVGACHGLNEISSILSLPDPTYDPNLSIQATGNDITNSLSGHIDTTSYTTQHYAFLTGQDNAGAGGIAWLSSTCLRLGTGG